MFTEYDDLLEEMSEQSVLFFSEEVKVPCDQGVDAGQKKTPGDHGSLKRSEAFDHVLNQCAELLDTCIPESQKGFWVVSEKDGLMEQAYLILGGLRAQSDRSIQRCSA